MRTWIRYYSYYFRKYLGWIMGATFVVASVNIGLSMMFSGMKIFYTQALLECPEKTQLALAATLVVLAIPAAYSVAVAGVAIGMSIGERK